MKTVALIFLAFLLAGCGAKWTTQDKALEAGYLTLHAIDWGQTVRIAREPDQYQENNPILGDHPSVNKVHAYFALTALGHVLITDLLPPKYRPLWQGLTGILEIGCISNNLSLGIGWGW